jgi:hypothetical protein
LSLSTPAGYLDYSPSRIDCAIKKVLLKIALLKKGC